MSILKQANVFSNNNNPNIGSSNNIGSIKLISKIGNDTISKQLLSELRLNKVNILNPIIPVSRKTPTKTTSVTTVIVSEDINERCCIHTPGTCDELTENEALDLHNNHNNNVIHLHCDTRHTKATYKLAYEIRNNQQERKKDTLISIDLEKDRGICMDKLVS